VDSLGNKTLTDWFDRIFVINRYDRPDRLNNFFDHIELEGLADRSEVTVYSAIIGDETSCPSYFKSGNAAWGCFRSHSNVVEGVIMEKTTLGEGLNSILILEDDVEFIQSPLDLLNQFMSNVPKDWDQIYLGGQHRIAPLDTKINCVKRGVSVNRGHAYALNSKAYSKFYSHINQASDYFNKKSHHFDHQLEVAHRRQEWNVYCPPIWLAGQCAGMSNICNSQLKSRNWH